ncbi:mannose-6-phosphate isomerase [Lasiosphaeria miniovina]|uniref:Mannose-6-phosphate isomerase n=1 Tax=Lasiosphaeria miniovina TaxID=1954250 RepID=A0AA40AK92_9PEZI|nr:mannose-6-phosphate isomerase [Lasiosphaeria miniovina]KAK0717413.1 mannose-6-phosphate isomerase [Lasiosphaeria miniovina]
MQIPLIRLQCGVNSYDWGKKGQASAAAKFAAATPSSDFVVQDDRPYAELWMGTHPSNPSRDLTTGRTLLDLIQDNRSLLSAPVAARYGQKLPFLLKVLSIDKALSIQAHPNKQLAEKLHAKDPKNYPDDNHKPEMAIAITPFEGLCGFRPLGEIVHFLETVPALLQLVGEEEASEFAQIVGSTQDDESEEAASKNKTALQKVFSALMASSETAMTACTKTLLDSVANGRDEFAGGGVSATPGSVLAELVTRLHGQFGPDYGLFVLFFLNYVTLQPGDALFLRADDIHAYLSGDIVECMASSDNVVRAGLTPKFKDVEVLTTMLTYNYAPIDEQKMNPSDFPYVRLNRTAYSSGSAVLLYDPPINEFSVVRSSLRGDGSKATFDPLDGPSIIICTAGRGKISVGPTVHEFKGGYVFFVGATAECVLESEGDEDDEFITFKAFCEAEDRSNGA